MKKEYRKPEMLFDDFSLSTSIANNCNVQTNNPSEGQCAYKMYFGTRQVDVFTNATKACATKVVDGYDEVCYHVPIARYATFS